MINQLVNQRYEVVEKIGDSPLFAVYRARDKVQNRVVAIKSVLAPYSDKQDFVEGLKSGLVASGSLKHPNIAQFYELGIEEGTPYAALEYVRGINLKERIRRIAPFTLSVAIDYACALGEALNHAHSLGQAHGDLRPENIVISPEGAVKITDFGIQRGIARCPEAQQQILARAAHYHAPELSTTQLGTPSGDIYALGSILYEMLTGTPLYAEGSPEAIADQHAFSAIPTPRAINQGVPRSVEGIIIKCLQKKPEQRYRTSLELLNDLKSVRDALRFGKPLSWSPIDIDNPATTAAPAKPVIAVAPAPSPAAPPPNVPVATVAASSVPAVMPAKNRLRAQDERVSAFIKVLIYIATAIIFACLIGFVGIWMTKWIVPQPVSLPQMVGKSIEDARAMAKTMHVTLKEHGDYMDKPRNLVYRTDPQRGDQIRPNHIVNVWYSKGPTHVDVPNVVGLTREEAEKKLIAAGLTVGRVAPEFSEKAARGIVLSQDVSYKKRVLHDQEVGLLVSDGPKPEFADPGSDVPPQPAPTPDNSGDSNPPEENKGAETNDGSSEETYKFRRTITINRDKLGTRQVRVEYTDADGEHPPVIEEPHGEGDKIPIRFEYRGKKITLRVYYDEVVKLELKDFDPQKQKNRRINGSGENR